MPQRFAYHRGIAPMMWVFVALAGIELIVVHFLLSFWSPHLALLLSAVTLVSIGWLAWVIWSMRSRPVLIDRDRLVMRVGTMRRIDIPLDEIAGLRPAWDATTIKQRSVLNLALIAYPNIVVDLVRVRPGRRGIMAVAHRLDDPVAFATALERLRAET